MMPATTTVAKQVSIARKGHALAENDCNRSERQVIASTNSAGDARRTRKIARYSKRRSKHPSREIANG
jgi:hypothetical protein